MTGATFKVPLLFPALASVRIPPHQHTLGDELCRVFLDVALWVIIILKDTTPIKETSKEIWMTKRRILSGMRPSGRLHLGNYLGALTNWVKLQEEYDCYFMVADWHALTDRTDTSSICEDTREVLIDWLAAGLDPDKSVLFVQSHIPEHAELHLILSMITPLSWLERCPTYKDKIATGASIHYGLLGYPVLQAADILMYHAEKVPVGEDQLPHLELTREIARRFNNLYEPVLSEPEPILSNSPRILGLGGQRKMGKSFGNYIALSDSPDIITKKIVSMFTDPKKIRKSDQGHPDTCNVHTYHTIFAPALGQSVAGIAPACQQGTRGCVACKRELAEILVEYLSPIREQRKLLEQDQSYLEKVVKLGQQRARAAASDTMTQIRRAIHFAC